MKARKTDRAIRTPTHGKVKSQLSQICIRQQKGHRAGAGPGPGPDGMRAGTGELYDTLQSSRCKDTWGLLGKLGDMCMGDIGYKGDAIVWGYVYGRNQV